MVVRNITEKFFFKKNAISGETREFWIKEEDILYYYAVICFSPQGNNFYSLKPMSRFI